jgi:prevent-host-death family protein
MIQQIEISEVKAHLPELLEEAIKGQEIVITENNQPLLKLTRVAPLQPARRLGSAKGKVWMSPDFNDSYEDFNDELL